MLEAAQHVRRASAWHRPACAVRDRKHRVLLRQAVLRESQVVARGGVSLERAPHELPRDSYLAHHRQARAQHLTVQLDGKLQAHDAA